MRLAAEHLLKLGHRDVALITGGPRRPARERRQAVEETFAGAGETTTCTVYDGDFSVAHGRRAAAAVLARRPRPTAIIAGGNILMQGALLALRDAGLEVGSDMSFVGCDDTVVAELHRPQIAVVRRDIRAAGSTAAELLLGQLDGAQAGESRREVVLPTEFVVRASCGPVGR
jgi:LacI family transcriptional regulator